MCSTALGRNRQSLNPQFSLDYCLKPPVDQQHLIAELYVYVYIYVHIFLCNISEIGTKEIQNTIIIKITLQFTHIHTHGKRGKDCR